MSVKQAFRLRKTFLPPRIRAFCCAEPCAFEPKPTSWTPTWGAHFTSVFCWFCQVNQCAWATNSHSSSVLCLNIGVVNSSSVARLKNFSLPPISTFSFPSTTPKHLEKQVSNPSVESSFVPSPTSEKQISYNILQIMPLQTKKTALPPRKTIFHQIARAPRLLISVSN